MQDVAARLFPLDPVVFGSSLTIAGAKYTKHHGERPTGNPTVYQGHCPAYKTKKGTYTNVLHRRKIPPNYLLAVVATQL